MQPYADPHVFIYLVTHPSPMDFRLFLLRGPDRPASLLTFNRNRTSCPVDRPQRTEPMTAPPGDVPYGTLDLLVLKTFEVLGPVHEYGIARRIEQVAQGSLALNQGTIYPALLRLEQKGWISSQWGARADVLCR